MIFDVIFIHDTDYWRVIIVRVGPREQECNDTIHLFEFKTVILRMSSRTVWFEGQHIDELYIYFQIIVVMLMFYLDVIQTIW